MKGRRGNNHLSPSGSPPSDAEHPANASACSVDASSKEQDRFLPIANVSRIMKRSLPANAKISKEAKETVQECVSEFISFITGEASDKCQREKRKTINGDDLLWAMTTLGFENYVGPLKTYLNKYRETEGEKSSGARIGDDQHEEEGLVQSPSSSRQVGSGSNPTEFNGGAGGGFYPAAGQGFGGGRMVGYGINGGGGGHGLRW